MPLLSHDGGDCVPEVNARVAEALPPRSEQPVKARSQSTPLDAAQPLPPEAEPLPHLPPTCGSRMIGLNPGGRGDRPGSHMHAPTVLPHLSLEPYPVGHRQLGGGGRRGGRLIGGKLGQRAITLVADGHDDGRPGPRDPANDRRVLERVQGVGCAPAAREEDDVGPGVISGIERRDD